MQQIDKQRGCGGRGETDKHGFQNIKAQYTCIHHH